MHMNFEPYVYTTSYGLPEQMKTNFQLLALTKNESCIHHGLFQGYTKLIASAQMLYLCHKQVLSETWNKYICPEYVTFTNIL